MLGDVYKRQALVASENVPAKLILSLFSCGTAGVPVVVKLQPVRWISIGKVAEVEFVVVRSFLEIWPRSMVWFRSAAGMLHGASRTEPVNVMVPWPKSAANAAAGPIRAAAVAVARSVFLSMDSPS